MEKWIIFTLIYAVCNSFFKVSKKKATEISSIYEVLALFSTFSFVIVACTTKDAFNIEPQFLLIILLKSVVVIVAWILGMYVISKMTISLYSNIEISRVIFSIIMGCVLFNEKITVQIFIGIETVLLVRMKKKSVKIGLIGLESLFLFLIIKNLKKSRI